MKDGFEILICFLIGLAGFVTGNTLADTETKRDCAAVGMAKIVSGVWITCSVMEEKR